MGHKEEKSKGDVAGVFGSWLELVAAFTSGQVKCRKSNAYG
jgi:hypothetical protein